MFKKEDFYKFIIQNGALGVCDKPISLNSGRKSPYYVNWRKVTNNPILIDELTDYIIDFAEKLDPQCFIGVPEGATKIALITQYKFAKMNKRASNCLPMIRGKPKSHGIPKDRFFIGGPIGRTILIEDTVTTGSSLLLTVYKLKKANIDLVGIIGLTDRNELTPIEGVDDDKFLNEYKLLYEKFTDKPYKPQMVKEIMDEIGIPYYAMSNARELLSELKMDKKTKNLIKEYFKKYSKVTL